jgi:glycine/D-amino acid oxidase-like deaminating enzyme
MAYAWTGVAALTPHFLPRLIEVAPGVIAPLACNGRGLCLTTALGAALATHALGRSTLPLPLEPYQPIRAHWVAQYLPRLLLPLGDLQDRRG